MGVPEYQQTAALWTRGVMQHEFGVAPEDLDWYMERTEERSHGGATGFEPPPGMRFHRIPPKRASPRMLLKGELDATAALPRRVNLVDRAGMDLTGDPPIAHPVPRPLAEGARYFQKTGIFPINHGMVVRRRSWSSHPWVAINLYKAFLAAKEQVVARARAGARILLPARLAAAGGDGAPCGPTIRFPTAMKAKRTYWRRSRATRTSRA